MRLGAGNMPAQDLLAHALPRTREWTSATSQSPHVVLFTGSSVLRCKPREFLRFSRLVGRGSFPEGGGAERQQSLAWADGPRRLPWLRLPSTSISPPT